MPRDQVTYPLFNHMLDQKVDDYITNENQWDLSTPRHWLPHECILCIAATVPPCNDSGPDSIAWKGRKDENLMWRALTVRLESLLNWNPMKSG